MVTNNEYPPPTHLDHGPVLISARRVLLRFIEIVIFILSILVVLLCIGEIVGRNTLQGQIQQQIVETADYLSKITSSSSSSSSAEISNSFIERQTLEAKQQLSALRILLNQVRLLQSVGSNDTRAGLPLISRDMTIILSGGMAHDTAIDSGIDSFGMPLGWYRILSSETLLAIVVCLTGMIGALIANFRTDVGALHRNIPLGLSAGFVVYLGVKGGKFVFLMQMQEGYFPMNPYGCAFAGLLAGLFTEKAYQLLTILIDEFTQRLTSAVSGEKSEKEVTTTERE